MTLRRYTLFAGSVLDRRAELSGKSPHYQILLTGAEERFRVAINTRSGSSRGRRADLLYFADDDFRHPIVRHLADVPDGPLAVAAKPGGLALDYQRGGMFDRRAMRRIPASRPGPRNDLTEELDFRVERALANSGIRLYAYGTRWGPEPRQRDQIFHFEPGNGIHDVHMNQGNRDEHRPDNVSWADGGLFFHEPDRERWCAIFLAFQTQSWHTDHEGNPVAGHDPSPEHTQMPGETASARIVSAFVHPNDRKVGVEHVVIRNDGDSPLDVSGWQLVNRSGDDMRLSGDIPPRRTRRFQLSASLPLSTNGGAIRLVDGVGAEIDEVFYTRREARQKRGALKF